MSISHILFLGYILTFGILAFLLLISWRQKRKATRALTKLQQSHRIDEA